MSERRFAAQEMREYADAIAGDLNDNGAAGATYAFDDLLPVIQSLRYSAGVVERCEEVLHDMGRDLSELNGYPMAVDGKAIIGRLNYILRGDKEREER